MILIGAGDAGTAPYFTLAQTPQELPGFLQCAQLEQFLHALQFALPVQRAASATIGGAKIANATTKQSSDFMAFCYLGGNSNSAFFLSFDKTKNALNFVPFFETISSI